MEGQSTDILQRYRMIIKELEAIQVELKNQWSDSAGDLFGKHLLELTEQMDDCRLHFEMMGERG